MPDNMTPAQRSWTMSRIRRANTKPELVLRGLLHRLGLRFRLHVATLPGCPDVVFARRKIAVFIDGDFWHGWRFSQWRHKLAPYWEAKIARNRARDERTFRKLRRHGWTVVRIWEHQLERDPSACAARVFTVVKEGRMPVNRAGNDPARFLPYKPGDGEVARRGQRSLRRSWRRPFEIEPSLRVGLTSSSFRRGVTSKVPR
jgi:DNA mismatch endonuclease (patch repair protein)